MQQLVDSEKMTSADLFHQDVVQIRFNAWHYMESNLWASLVEYIFSELDKWLRLRGPGDQVNALFDNLATAREMKLEALEQLAILRGQEKAAQANLDDARKAVELARLLRPKKSHGQFWDAVRRTLTAKAGTDTKKTINRAGDKLGISDLYESTQELRKVIAESQEQGGRVRLITTSLVGRLGNPRWFMLVGGALVLAPAVIGWVIEKYDFDAVSSFAASLSSIVAILTVAIGAAVKAGSRALDTLQTFDKNLQAAIEEEAKKPSVGVAEPEIDFAEKQADLEQAESNYAERAEELRDAASKFEIETPRGRLNNFIRDKAGGDDYSKHLGIIASIRKDFAQLSEIMAASDTGSDKEVEADQEAYEAKVNTLVEIYPNEITNDEKMAIKAPPLEHTLKGFQRIILYIDDLDRCPPDKVVAVLEAVHLLLYFRLFVVVVAVDARWLSHSLTNIYPDLLTAEDQDHLRSPDGAAGERNPNNPNTSETKSRIEKTPQSRNAASPNDYLEKIFQLPYWVRQMEGAASAKHLAHLIGDDEEFSPIGHGNAGVGQSDRQISPKSGQADENVVGPLPADPDETPTQNLTPRQSLNEAPEEAEEKRAEVVASMTLTTHEKEFMEALAPHAGRSPRQILRFANVYRLVKTSLKPADREILIGDGDTVGCRTLLAQLAIATGSQSLAPVYFRELRESKKTDLSGFIKDFNAKLSGVDEKSERSAIIGALECLRKHASQPISMEHLRETAPIAMRYSFFGREAAMTA